jgi:membrane protease YdiL (CAAX protease family)
MFGNSSKKQPQAATTTTNSFPNNPFQLIDAGIVLISFLVSIIISVSIILIRALFNIQSFSETLHIPADILQISAEYLVAGCIMAVIYVFIYRKYHLSWQSFGFKQLPVFKTIAYVALAFLLTFVAWIIVAPLILVFLPFINLEESQEIFQPNMSQIAQILLIFYAVIIGPLLEEIVFRGIILPAVSNRWNFVVGVILSTIIWSLLHLQLNVIIFTSIFGIVLSYIYLKSQSLWPSFLTHVLKNLIAVIAIYLFGFY